MADDWCEGAHGPWTTVPSAVLVSIRKANGVRWPRLGLRGNNKCGANRAPERQHGVQTASWDLTCLCVTRSVAGYGISRKPIMVYWNNKIIVWEGSLRYSVRSRWIDLFESSPTGAPNMLRTMKCTIHTVYPRQNYHFGRRSITTA